MLRLLVVGAGGQVGGKIGQLAKRRGHFTLGTYRSRKPQSSYDETYLLDKTNKNLVHTLLAETKPDVVIDTGALHNVDYCESHPDEAMAVNYEGTGNLSSASAEIGAKFVFVSTDYVFDGEKGSQYSEDESPNPESAYSKSKLKGENATISLNKDSVVCRPSVIYSHVAGLHMQESSSGKPLNFGAWLVSQLVFRKEVKIVTDQIASPTLADDLAGAILSIAQSPQAKGIYHTAGATPLSRFEFCLKIAEKLGLETRLILPVESSSLKQLAKRPRNSSLSSFKLEKEIGYKMMDIDTALDVFASQYKLDSLLKA